MIGREMIGSIYHRGLSALPSVRGRKLGPHSLSTFPHKIPEIKASMLVNARAGVQTPLLFPLLTGVCYMVPMQTFNVACPIAPE